MSTTRRFKNCQSCGMPLRRDDRGGGTDADGTKSEMFCSRCYQDGRFTMPDLTAGQMQDLVRRKLKEMGFPGFMAVLFTLGIPRLERWKRS